MLTAGRLIVVGLVAGSVVAALHWSGHSTLGHLVTAIVAIVGVWRGRGARPRARDGWPPQG